MKVLVAIDGPDQFHPAVQALASQQLPAGSEVRVVSVVYSGVSYSWETIDMNVYDVMEKRLREIARVTVDKAAETLRADVRGPSRTVTSTVLSGSPPDAILEEADAFGADWIFVGSHGHGRLERFMLGSVSQAVAGRAKCSVAIARGPHAPTNDGQRGSDAAVKDVVRSP